MRNWKHRRLVLAFWDAISWLVAVPLAATLRYDFNPPSHVVELAVLVGAACATLYILIGTFSHLYRGRYVVGSFDEVFGIGITSLIVGGIGSLAVLLLPATEFPRSTVIIATGLAAASMLGARFFWRGHLQQSALGRQGSRTLIYGAGDAGSQVVNLMITEKNGAFQPVGFIDDDPSKQHLRRGGIRVLGTLNELETIAVDQKIETLLIAIAGITAPNLLELDRRCKSLGISMSIIPTASEIAGGAVKLGDISDVTEEDLMGRHPIKTDEAQITEFIRGRRVLVTGAGGSIGSELVRQLTRYEPAQLFLLDRDESALHAVQLTLDGSGTLTSDTLVLADIRDSERIDQVFNDLRPEIIFHAAALKHLPLLEKFPGEAFKTNVIGTRNVLSAAMHADVKTFVNISTDKAADPSSILGHSKLITERLTAGTAPIAGRKFVSVRFGNVLGSRGSVLHTFRYQIANGGPITVTDEKVTRYFMTVSEAVHLVLQASVLGSHGETLVLDMGTPVRIADVARYMVEKSGRDIEIKYTGLRPGEKLDEVLIAREEAAARPHHKLISHTKVTKLDRHQIPEEISLVDARRQLLELSSANHEIIEL